jgi:hypothetical protein
VVFLPQALTSFTGTDSYLSEVTRAGQGFGFYELCPFGLHLAKSQLRLVPVTRTRRVGDNCYPFAALQQTESGGFDSTFGHSSNQNELIGANLTQQPVNSRLVKRVEAAFVKNDLVINPQYVLWQVGAAVRHKTRSVLTQRISYLLLSLGAVDAVTVPVTVIFGIDLSSRYYADVPASGPGQDTSDIGQNPPMVSYTCCPTGKQKISLRVNVDQNASASYTPEWPKHSYPSFSIPQFDIQNHWFPSLSVGPL